MEEKSLRDPVRQSGEVNKKNGIKSNHRALLAVEGVAATVLLLQWKELKQSEVCPKTTRPWIRWCASYFLLCYRRLTRDSRGKETTT